MRKLEYQFDRLVRMPEEGQVWGINVIDGQRSIRVVGLLKDKVYFRYHDLETMEWHRRIVVLTLRTFLRRAWYLREDVAWAKSSRTKEKGL